MARAGTTMQTPTCGTYQSPPGDLYFGHVEKGIELMSSSSRLPLLLGLLSAAMACYFLGFISGVIFFLVAGVIIEFSFWVQLFRRRH